jgi:hypothetical protein
LQGFRKFCGTLASAGFLLPGIKQQSIFTQPTILRYQRKNFPLQKSNISV